MAMHSPPEQHKGVTGNTTGWYPPSGRHPSVVDVIVESVVLLDVVIELPQSGGVGFVAALHVALPALNSDEHVDRHALPGL
jgi:hypothetical protein